MAGDDIPLRTYRVTGPTAFLGREPGEEFRAKLDPDLERRALARGSIRVVTKAKPKAEKEAEA